MKAVIRLSRCQIMITLVVVLFCIGCKQRERQEQNQLEGFTAATIQKFLDFGEERFTEKPLTNVIQVFEMMDLTSAHRSHPYVLQQHFRKFGANAGFNNSIYEKYVLVPSGLVDRAIKGEMIFMSGQPFPDLDGQRVRMVIWKAGKQDYRSTKLREERVQEMFRTLNKKIPLPPPMPSPSPPPDFALSGPSPWKSVNLYFRDIAGGLGIRRGSWWILLLLLGFGVVAVGTTLVFFFVNRRRWRRE
jgi:hypothetical protein